MQFAIIARDSGAEGTLERRLSCRDEHLERLFTMKRDGKIVDGGAMLDAEGRMVGSVVLCDFPDRATLDNYLSDEVYAREGIWQDIEVLDMRLVSWPTEASRRT